MKNALTAAVILLALTGCTINTARVPQTEASTVPEVQAAPPTPPTTARSTPRTTPPPAPQTYGGYDYRECDDIDLGEVSDLIPTDWDEWCRAVHLFAAEFASSSASDRAVVCDGFWDTDDDDLIDLSMDSGLSRNAAIGVVDWLWHVC
jgi:hypothetical protein